MVVSIHMYWGRLTDNLNEKGVILLSPPHASMILATCIYTCIVLLLKCMHADVEVSREP